MSFDGKTYGIAYDGNAHNLFYRRDLFENADYKKKFADQYGYELAPPDNWEQFHDVAKFFNELRLVRDRQELRIRRADGARHRRRLLPGRPRRQLLEEARRPLRVLQSR